MAPRQCREGEYWIEPGPNCPDSIQVVEGPVKVRGGASRCIVDLLVEDDCRVGPGNFGLVQARQMTDYDRKI